RPVWLGGEVKKILSTEAGWYFLSSRGVVYSRDLSSFEERNKGLPVKTIKRYDQGVKSFQYEIQDLKDLEADPYDPRTLVTCTKDAVFLTRDAGLSWTSLPAAPSWTTGLKAVSVVSGPENLIFASHPIRGVFTRPLGNPGAAWTEAGGLDKSAGSASPDEVSDIAASKGSEGARIWAANSFLARLYRWDSAKRSFTLVHADDRDFAPFDSLQVREDGVLYVTDGEVYRYDPRSGRHEAEPGALRAVLAASRSQPGQLESFYGTDSAGRPIRLSELWLAAFKDRKPHRPPAEGRHGLYLQTGFMVNPETRAKYLGILDRHNLDSVVVDLKDDLGRLRFEPRTELVRRLGRTVNPLDVETFAAEMKARGVYLIARIVVFKDAHMYKAAGGKYAVWDSVEKAHWRGYFTEKVEVSPSGPSASPSPSPPVLISPSKPGAAPAAPPAAPVYQRKYMEEYWVDPYSEEIWEYNVAIAKEIIARGFDEVQFDYIRFPTDGENLGNASYRWRDPGMDMESALMSFLGYARRNIEAPISIDIYGANGWFRSGVRTGQDVELLARYADVICPMFYPSHFEQDFLAQPPEELRPYRIYYLGTLRNTYIARKRVVVRPYVQAFFLNVRYDRKWYNPDYVRRQVEGVRDSVNLGLTFWNNIGRYDDIPVLDVRGNRRLAAGQELFRQTGVHID
ncbi:MAG: hypothetical protein GX430_10425, partial [Treponema sp.]|nr:hypothetical protein [Treponema sp.]